MKSGKQRKAEIKAHRVQRDRVHEPRVDDGPAGARLVAGISGLAALEQLLGLDRRPTIADLASSLDCSPGAVAAVLAKRGDTDMANAVRRLR